MPPSVAELKELEATLTARADDLDRREAAVTVRETELGDAGEQAELKARELDERESSLNEREAEVESLRAAATLGDPTERALPDGYGVALVQMPVELTTALARLHPSERLTIAAHIAGSVRQTLIETGKLGRGVLNRPPRIDASDPITYAELVPGEVEA